MNNQQLFTLKQKEDSFLQLQSTINECSSTTVSENILNLSNLNVSGGSSVGIIQSSVIRDAQDCILSATLSASALDYLKNSSSISADQKASLDAKGTFSGDTSGKAGDKEKTTSFLDIIGDMIKNIGLYVVIAGVVIAIVVIVIFVLPMFKGKGDSSSQINQETLNKALKFVINFSK